MNRGKKIVAIAHCYLNQNARVKPYASKKGSFKALVQPLIENDYGIIQLPCPETTGCGLNRWEAVTEQYDNPGFRRHCRNLLQPYVDQMLEHQKVGDKIYAVLGVPFSPCCGTQFNPSNPDWGGPVLEDKAPPLKIVPGPAVFMQEFMQMAKDSGLKLDFMDISETEDMFPDLQPEIVLKKILEN